MFCSKCGAEFSGNAQFCVQCGASAPGRPSAAFDGVEQNPYATPTQANVNINTYLIPNILVTIFCSRLLGVVGCIFSILASNALKSGNFDDAQSKAKVARVMFWAALIVGLITFAVFFCWVIFVASQTVEQTVDTSGVFGVLTSAF